MPFFLSRNKKETATRASHDVVRIMGSRCPLLDPFSRQSSGLTNCIEKRNKKWTSGGHPTIRDIYTTSMCIKNNYFTNTTFSQTGTNFFFNLYVHRMRRIRIFQGSILWTGPPLIELQWEGNRESLAFWPWKEQMERGGACSKSPAGRPNGASLLLPLLFTIFRR